ncbi:DUF4365 domain-containing protein [Urbifossiella limnaea]|uniref:DUF4365 domain-containing protein n=1 Tax=Urbifossiella limnaea TaxID=2528023 RepID=A0A517XLJ4_9BACT|nr:DUF4365 domain-containing protein [Urbifossiella limnaea]QDU18374.1 hypothetical protein ETAA1_02600 [Urbifossiella limnaea]
MGTEDTGSRGEAECHILLSELCGRRDPLFRPQFLGDKHPALDFLVILLDRPEFYFFVQVKATRLGYTKNPRRLRVSLEQAEVDQLVACPAPTYLVGVDAAARGVGYLLSVNEPRRRVASLTTKFPIDSTLLLDLQDEVVAFWTTQHTRLRNSRFRE